jgi:urea carboxylase-associated protein 1
VTDDVIPARSPWSGVVPAGHLLTLTDLEGNQAVDCLLYNAVGGACSKESNTLRYGHHTKHQHACVENFLREGAKWGLTKRDLVSNINWYMNVPVEEDGTLGIVDGISAPGLAVTLRAEIDTLVLISNCPQVNNPCNGFDPTPVRVVVGPPA